MDNDLLVTTTEVIAVTNGPGGLVMVGVATTRPDPEAVLARFAPELADSGIARVTRESVEVHDADGDVLLSIPLEEIEPRLTELGGLLLDTIVWRSPDGTDWQQTALFENGGPGFLGSHAEGYVLTVGFAGPTRVLTSPRGVEWGLITELPAPRGFALHEGALIAAQESSLTRVDPDGGPSIISGGPAFSGSDLTDLTLGEMAAGPYGVLAAGYDPSIGSTPYVSMWYSPDGRKWSRQDLAKMFGSEGDLLVAVGQDEVLVANDPDGQGGLPLGVDFQLWIGTNSG